jgi:hypothetical protein
MAELRGENRTMRDHYPATWASFHNLGDIEASVQLSHEQLEYD